MVSEGEAGPSGQGSKRQKTADFTYSPQEMVDFVVKSSDGKTIGCHRVFILRYSKMFARLLRDLEETPDTTAAPAVTVPTEQVPVTETFQNIKENLLDIMYDRSINIGPENVLAVLELADKYEAPNIVEGCGIALASPAFKITASTHIPEEERAKSLRVVEGLILALKHNFNELKQRCLKTLEEAVTAGNTESLTALMTQKTLLATMPSEDLAELISCIAGASVGNQGRMTDGVTGLKASFAQQVQQHNKTTKELEKMRKNYADLLKKYNKLLEGARKGGVHV